ncbi:PA14 domain-containing protein [Luteolibacter sp. LG18]|uniref:PA14 domain-containing protein n=1 Tax=Luteolibacter sp. LG18 TaxID=2819286 RepID=UPI0030C75379
MTILSRLRDSLLRHAVVLVGCLASAAGQERARDEAAGVRGLLKENGGVSRGIDLRGDLTWVSPAGDAVVLQDDSGAVRLELDRAQPGLVAGGRVSIAGIVRVAQGALRCGPVPLVDVDGAHGLLERAGAIHLDAGRHPLRVEYFQRDRGKQLAVGYEGPDLPRQPVPAGALSHPGAPGREEGLRYAIYEGSWDRLPVFGGLVPKAGGVVRDFDLSVAGRDENFGIVFTGELEIPRTGDYRFHLASNDGGRLFVGEAPPVVTALGSGGGPGSAAGGRRPGMDG